MISTNQFRSGLYIKFDDEIYVILESQHHKPGQRGAIVRTRLKNMKTGAVLDKTFRSGEVVGEAYIEEKKCQYLYRSRDEYYFMDNTTYEQTVITEEKIGDVKWFLKENTEVTFVSHEGVILNIKLPIFMDLKVAEVEPGARGDTVKASLKTAKLETGYAIQVPLFINNGDMIRVDTRTGEYIGRA
ncbi:MAG: elongation factor P [Candidatus Omnitrophica bacterium]|nr:elongation factor P [Candidatus Omnitrophota bacterium]